MSGIKSFSLYGVYDVLSEDFLNIFPCPSDNAAILGFSNSKKQLEEKGYNPRLLVLYSLGSWHITHLKSGLSINLADVNSSACKLCDLENAPIELERITNELLESDNVMISG